MNLNYCFFQMRSDMKEVLKSPSPDAEQSPTSSVHLDHKTSLFHLSDSNTDSNELKASKESGSSDTQSEDEEEEEFVGKKRTPVVVAPPLGKGRAKKEVVGRRSGVEKDSEKSSLSKILGTDTSILSDKDMKVEVMLVDVAKKGGLGLKGSLLAVAKQGEKMPQAAGRKSTGEKLGPLPVVVVKQEKGGVAGGKAAGAAKAGFGVDGEVKVKKDDPSCDSDVYEFKEPEPFEFEAAATTSRKPPLTSPSSSTEEVKPGPVGKGKKRLLDLEAKNNSSPPAQTTAAAGKKVKRSPGKAGAGLNAQLSTPPDKATTVSDPFDVLRKSPNFNVPAGGGALDSLPEFTQKLSSTEGFSNPVSSAVTGASLATISVAVGGGGGPALGLSPMKLANAANQSSSSSSLVSSAFVNTRNDDDQWQSLRMFKSAVEGHGIDMEEVLAKTKVMKEVHHPQQKGSGGGGGGGGGNNSSGSGSEFEGKTERSSIADKFLKTLNHGGGSSNSSSPSSSGEGPSAMAAAKSGSIFGRDFADKAKKEHLKLDLASAGGVKATGLVSSPDKLDALLELNPPKNNVLSETILKLKSAINDDEDDEEGEEGGDGESTDSERERLVIQDEEEEEEGEDDDDDEEEGEDEEDEAEDDEQSQSSGGVKGVAIGGGSAPVLSTGTITATATALTMMDPATAAAAAALVSGLSVKIKEEVTISSVTLKEQSMSFATKFHESFYGSQTTTLTPSLVKASDTAQTDLTCEESMDEACEATTEKKAGVGLRASLEAKEAMSVSVLLCEETIPTSPCHQAQRSEKLLLLEERKGTLESRLLGGVKSLGQTPNSSPRDSQSGGDESKSDSEDLKKNGEWGELKVKLKLFCLIS